MEIHRPPRNKEDLLREVDVRMRLGEIKKMYDMKDRLNPKWWESLTMILMFVSTLGLLLSLYLFKDMEQDPPRAWILFWLSMLILSIVFSFEFLLFKVYALRRANDLLVRLADDMQGRHDRAEKRMDAISAAVEKLAGPTATHDTGAEAEAEAQEGSDASTAEDSPDE